MTLRQVRLVQKTDTGKIYAMKTLKKDEMLKKDQVRLRFPECQCNPNATNQSLRMFEQNATSLQNLIHLGWFNSITHFKIPHSFT